MFIWDFKAPLTTIRVFKNTELNKLNNYKHTLHRNELCQIYYSSLKEKHYIQVKVQQNFLRVSFQSPWWLVFCNDGETLTLRTIPLPCRYPREKRQSLKSLNHSWILMLKTKLRKVKWIFRLSMLITNLRQVKEIFHLLMLKANLQ